MAERKPAPSLYGSRYEKAEGSPGFLFWKAFNNWSRQIRAELEKVDLTQIQYSILAATSYLSSVEKHVSQQAIASQLSMDKMMVSDVVKTLERKRLVVRKSNPDDGRSLSLYLTPEARRRLKQAVLLVEVADKRFFGVIGSKRLKNFGACLEKLGVTNLRVVREPAASDGTGVRR